MKVLELFFVRRNMRMKKQYRKKLIIIYWFAQWKFGKSEWCWFWKHTHCVFCFSNAPTKWVVCAECCFCPSSWHHLLILKTPPHQQMVSLRRTETTNCAVTEHNPHQQMCWSTKWVGRPDCCFWHPFTFLVTPISTKWVTDPISGPGGRQGAPGGSELLPTPKWVIKQQHNGSKPWSKVPKVCPDPKGMVLIHFWGVWGHLGALQQRYLVKMQ